MARLRQGKRMKWLGMPAAAAAIALLAPAYAQAPVTGFTSIGGDNAKKPINIESDRLEVDDKKHVAIFSGNVSATQGDFNLKAPRLEVTYEKQEQAEGQNKAAPPKSKQSKPADTAAADPLSSGQIKFIHATGGKVVVTSAKDEQEVTGDDAVYDVKGQKVVMTGKEVILTQKKNVVKGRQLNIDLATGRATVIPEKGRVQAVFTQEGNGAATFNPFGATKNKEAHAPEEPKPAQEKPGWKPKSD
jgi:lipopolysaccharide export system protein LptA